MASFFDTKAIECETELAALGRAVVPHASDKDAADAVAALVAAAGRPAAMDAVGIAAFFALITRIVDITGHQDGAMQKRMYAAMPVVRRNRVAVLAAIVTVPIILYMYMRA